VNSYIHKENFQTRFDLASKVADMVSFTLYLFPTTFFTIYLCTLLCFVHGAAFYSLQRAIWVFASQMRYLSSWQYVEYLPSFMVGSLRACLIYGGLIESLPRLWWAH